MRFKAGTQVGLKEETGWVRIIGEVIGWEIPVDDYHQTIVRLYDGRRQSFNSDFLIAIQ